MIVSLFYFKFMIYMALGITTLSPFVLVFLAFKDWRKERLW
jgi:hypothetical protein